MGRPFRFTHYLIDHLPPSGSRSNQSISGIKPTLTPPIFSVVATSFVRIVAFFTLNSSLHLTTASYSKQTMWFENKPERGVGKDYEISAGERPVDKISLLQAALSFWHMYSTPQIPRSRILFCYRTILGYFCSAIERL